MLRRLSLIGGFLLITTVPFLTGADRKVKNPTLFDTPDGTRLLVVPEDVQKSLSEEFPGFRFPADAELSPEMFQYYNSRLLGVHPVVAWGDFNGDKKRDYVFLLITGDTKWGPLCELVILNGSKSGYFAYRLGEVYNFKDDYVTFSENKLYKGRYRKGGWRINWDPKKSTYDVLKS
jgi:hypothetical protein